MAEPRALSDGTWLRWRAHGTSARGRCPVVFIHGVGMSGAFWAPQLERFEADRTCIAYDILGHGNSPLPPEISVLEDYTRQLGRLLNQTGTDHAVIVGHSMGALVALEYALQYPGRVVAAVMMNAVFRRSPEQKAAIARRVAALHESGSATGREETLSRWFGPVVPVSLQPHYAALDQALQQVDPVGYLRSYRLFAGSDDIHAARLPTLRTPAWFLTGALDANSTPAMAEEMARLAPQGHAVILPDARHMMSFLSPASTNAVLDTVFGEADRLLGHLA